MDFERKQSYLEIPIQVGVRLRPVLDTDDPPSDERVELLPSGQVTVEGHLFDPSFCLPATVGQQELYMVAVEPQVDMLLQGYNVAVMTFGQTGSGKTYTLVGPDATFAMSEAEFGVLPRAVRHVFAALKSSHEVAEHVFTVRASYLEVGQEEIRDLLNYEAISYHLNVQYDAQGSPVVPGLTRLECSSVSEVLHCLESGSSMRQAGSTAASDLQAHTIFTVHVQQEWADGMLLHETSSSMHFVELSGSELQPAPDDPDDFTINAGLLALRRTIEALARRRPSVPYHVPGCPLPALLKDVVGGNCRTLVLCCLSPADTDESLNSLQYVRLLPAVHNLVVCGASQRPLPPPEPEPQEPESAGSGPARQVHPVHPLRHLHPGSPRPEVKDAAAPAAWQAAAPVAGYGASGFGGEVETPGAGGWGVTTTPTAGAGGGYQVGYGAFQHEVAGSRRMSSAQQRLSSHGQVTLSPAQQMMAQNQQAMGQNQHVLGPNQQMMTQNQQQRMSQTQQMLNTNQSVMSPSQPMMNQNQQMMGLNQQVMNQNQALINPNQQIMNQNQAMMAHNQNQQEQVMLSRNQQLLSPNQLALNHNMNQNHMNLNQPLSPLNHQPPLLSHSHHNLNLIQPPLNQSVPALNQSLPALNHPLSAVNPDHLMNQTLPVFGSQQSLALGPARPAGGGHQSALVHPYHHQASPAGRLAGLHGYTASPPLTNLTELSCQRAALLHENALVDLYQRLHVLELHQLAAAQQAALASQAPPPRPEPEKQEDDQLFQLEFAADQYRRLVSGAERLLRELAGRGAVDGEQSGRIQQWMCSKQETEECLRQEQEQESELRQPGSEPGADRPTAGTASHAGASSAAVAARPAVDTSASGVDGLGESLSATLRLGERPPLDTTPAALVGEPADASTPIDTPSATRGTVTASDQPQTRGKLLTEKLVAKGLPDDTGQDGTADPADQLRDLRRSEERGRRSRSSPDREEATGGRRDRTRASLADTPVTRQSGGSGCRTRSPSSDPFQRRRRQACTEDDLRVLRDSDGLEALRERLTDGAGGAEPAAAETAAGTGPTASEAPETVGDRPADAADLESDLDPVRPAADDPSCIRREIQLLRECRESLHNQARRIKAKQGQGRQLDAAENRRLLELDEAMHAVDEVLEHKACRLAGGAPPEDARRLLLNQRLLMPRLLGLAAVELRLLYCRTFQRLVDQRIDGKEKDIAVADLDAQTMEQARGLKRLQRMVHDLMRERSHYRRQRDELRRRLHGPRGSGTAPLTAGAAPPPPPPAAAAAATAHSLQLESALQPAVQPPVQPSVQPAPLVHSRAPSDASSAPEPVLAPTSAPHRLRQMLLSGLTRPAASTPAARVTRQRNRIIIQSAAQPTEKRTKR